MAISSKRSEVEPLIKKHDTSCNAAIRVRILTCLTSLAEGYDISCIAGAAVLFAEQLDLQKHEIGIIMGGAHLSMAAGALLAGVLQDMLGRKPALAIAYGMLAFGSLVMAFASAFLELLIGRLFVGLGVGIGLAVVSTYVAEVAPAEQRGFYACLEGVFINIGLLAGYLGNYYLHGMEHDWRWMLGLGAVAPILFMVLLMTPLFPESPRYYFLLGQEDEAKRILSSLVEADEVESTLTEWQKDLQRAPLSWMQVICPQSSHRRWALLAGMGVCIAQLLSGVPVVGLYLTHLLDAELPTKAAFFHVVCVGCVRVICSAVATCLLVDHWGRRPLLLWSAGGIVLSHLYLSTVYLLQLNAVPWKLLGFYAFSVFYEIGLGPVTWVYIGECLDNEMRSKGVSLSLSASRIGAFFMLLLFPVVSSVAVFFIGLALCNLGILVFIQFLVPETKQLCLEKVHEVFAPSAL